MPISRLLAAATLALAALAPAAAQRAPSPVPGYYLPNAELTPGHVASVSRAEVCQDGYPERARKVTAARKQLVYVHYGVDPATCRGGCKIDHLIPLAIGGSNDLANLWPHEYNAEWDVYEKTRLETRLRRDVCAGRTPIREAQACIRADWTACYERHFPGAHAARGPRARR
jgi:hypothetical protein